MSLKPSAAADKQKRSRSKKDRKKQKEEDKPPEESDEEKVYVPIDKDKLNFCKYRGCQQHKFGPHKHYLVSQFSKIIQTFIRIFRNNARDTHSVKWPKAAS